MRRIAIYTRVSTHNQTTENQERELRKIARRMGWKVVKVYTDQAMSGAKGGEQRPAFKAMSDDAKRRKFDLVAAWSVDRLGRSLQDLAKFLADLHALKIDLFLHQQAVDTTTPGGKAMFGMMGVFAEFERAMILDRVRSGVARARAEGKKFGRPKLSTKKESAIRAALAKGDQGILKIAKALKVGTGTVQRIKAQQAAEETGA